MTSHRTLDPEIVSNNSVPVRRRRWTAAEKARIVEEAQASGMSVSAVARLYGIAPSVLFRWRKLMEEGGLSAISANEPVVGVSELKQLKNRIKELERILGQKTMEAEILQEALEAAHEKKLKNNDHSWLHELRSISINGGSQVTPIKRFLSKFATEKIRAKFTHS